MNRFFLLIIVLFLLGSCMNRPVTSVREEVILDKPTFPNITVMGTFHKPLNEILNIQDWDIIDSSIVCLSSNRDTVFYKYDAKDFSFQKSFGIIGQGPEEYAFPSIVRHSGNLCIIDHGNLSFNTVSSNDMKHKLHDLKLSQPANYPLLYSDSLFCFVGNTPNAIFLYLYNLHTQSNVV